ncbi:hypothetical protein JQX13_32950 [Archangium violaceum]|uniref:hypothetical protein n=1 Tax=Archangium violaceum TaxID=83451 RepID=UPI00193C5AE1|nr:hypothetical protein [Archangium violaceum]QRK04997.1 hypothetical protein JQX13_32950 [Archangium violaceum]
MADTTDPKYLDKRTADRYLRSGELDEKAYQHHIESLPDVAEKAVPVETVMHDELENDEDFDDEDFDDEDDDEDLEDEEDEGDKDSESAE